MKLLFSSGGLHGFLGACELKFHPGSILVSTEKIRNSRLKRISTKIYKKAEKGLVVSSVELRNSLYTTVISKFSPIFRPDFRSVRQSKSDSKMG